MVARDKIRRASKVVKVVDTTADGSRKTGPAPSPPPPLPPYPLPPPRTDFKPRDDFDRNLLHSCLFLQTNKPPSSSRATSKLVESTKARALLVQGANDNIQLQTPLIKGSLSYITIVLLSIQFVEQQPGNVQSTVAQDLHTVS